MERRSSMTEHTLLALIGSFFLGLFGKIIWDWLHSGRVSHERFISRIECEKCSVNIKESIERIEKTLEKLNEKIDKICMQMIFLDENNNDK
jgi:hypothetical protein